MKYGPLNAKEHAVLSPMNDPDRAEPHLERLRAAVAALGLRVEQVWLAYFGLGGNAPPEAVGAWLDGSATPDRGNYNVLSVAVNEELTSRGLDAEIPYAHVSRNN